MVMGKSKYDVHLADDQRSFLEAHPPVGNPVLPAAVRSGTPRHLHGRTTDTPVR